MTLPKLTGGDYEILVVGAKKIGIKRTNMSNVIKLASQLNLPEEKLLGDWIVTIPGFTLEKYRKLQRSRLSIFSANCIGGFLSHTLGLPFLSPLGTNGVNNADFIKFMREPRRYMQEKLVYNGTKYGRLSNRNILLSKLGDISMSMMHYKTFEKFVEMWERRKPRINWYNIFVVMCSTSPKELEQFDALPYGKKVCFVPFKSDLDSAWYINPEIKKGWEFWNIVNNFALGNPFYYDVFDMLLYGKKTPLIEM